MSKKMSYVDALNFVLSTAIEDEAVVERLTALRDSLVRRAENMASNEKAKAANEKRKVENAERRAALMAEVLPVLRTAIGAEPLTAEQIYEKAKSGLPTDFNTKKVQYILIHELANEVVKIDNGRNSKTYKKA